MTKTQNKVKACYRNTVSEEVARMKLEGAYLKRGYVSVLEKSTVGVWFITLVSGSINHVWFTH